MFKRAIASIVVTLRPSFSPGPLKSPVPTNIPMQAFENGLRPGLHSQTLVSTGLADLDKILGNWVSMLSVSCIYHPDHHSSSMRIYIHIHRRRAAPRVGAASPGGWSLSPPRHPRALLSRRGGCLRAVLPARSLYPSGRQLAPA